VFSCLPSTDALDDVIQGPHGLVQTARPGQIVVELGSHPVPDKKRQIAPLQQKLEVLCSVLEHAGKRPFERF